MTMGETAFTLWQSAPTAASVADRVAKYVATRNEIGIIPLPRHPRLVDRCRTDLALFGRYYCKALLDHPPSEVMKERLISKLETALIYGGQLAVEFSRGAGKTTWTIIALVWAILYGHRHFLVCIAASRPLAKAIRRAVYDLLAESDEILADFPAVPTALRAMNGVVQKGMALTYQDRSVNFESSELYIRFPNLRDRETGKPIDHACGAILACRGVMGSVRGLNVSGERPDFILFDDPQTPKDAKSPTAVQRLDDFIHSDALNLSANTSTMAAFITITPQRLGDLAMRIADSTLHPNWSVSRCPFIIQACPDFDAKTAGFLEAFAFDAARDDFMRTSSRQWYMDNRELFAGTVTVDPLAYDPKTEIDSIHHALCKIASVGRDVFNSEYQMEVRPDEGLVAVDADTVANSLNGYDAWRMPPGFDKIVVAVDVNINPGLSYVALALGERNTAAVIGYGRYPAHGPLCAASSPVTVQRKAVAAAIATLVARFDRMTIPAATGPRRFRVRAISFDRGWFPSVVCKTLARLRKSTTAVLDAIRGAGNNYRPPKNAVFGDHMYYGQSKEDQIANRSLGDYLTIHSNYWEEIAQTTFLETALLPGSCSLWGSDATVHKEFAAEVTNRKLIDKSLENGHISWRFAKMGPEHYLDALKMAFALAAWHHCYTAAAPIKNIAKAQAEASLFDPMQNPAILKNAAEVQMLPLDAAGAKPAAATKRATAATKRTTAAAKRAIAAKYPAWYNRRHRR